MQTFIVYTVQRKTTTGIVHQEISRDSAPELGSLQGGRDYIINKEGKLYKVVEQVIDLKAEEKRIIVKEV